MDLPSLSQLFSSVQMCHVCAFLKKIGFLGNKLIQFESILSSKSLFSGSGHNFYFKSKFGVRSLFVPLKTAINNDNFLATYRDNYRR